MIKELFITRFVTLHSLLVMVGLAIYIMGSHARRQRRHPSAAIAWLISLALLPYVALPLYLLVGSRKVAGHRAALRPPILPDKPHDLDSPALRFQHLAAAMHLPRACAYTQLAVHQDGHQALAALQMVMVHATRTLDVSTFILGRDLLGNGVANALIERAQAGVQVRLLIDGIGVYLGGRPNIRRLSAAGVKVALFVSPLHSPLAGRTNLRNHRKMAIADGVYMWSGGRNLAAEYFLGNTSGGTQESPWIDLSFDFQGPLAHEGQNQFNQDWAFATQTVAPAALPTTSCAAGPGQRSAQLVPSGPDQTDDTLYSLLISSCFTARKRILAVTPYLVPDATLLMALTLAARRGVAVDIILPRRSNHRLADMARRPALRELSQAGARIWLMPEMIHAKGVVIDEELALAGSANLDERSMFLNYELMIAFFAPADVQQFADWLEHQKRTAAQHVPGEPGILREFSEGVIRWVAFQL
jgi:cardiolipin synthase A/B